MLALRRELRLGRGSLAWVEDWCTDSCLAYLNGTTLVLMNVGHEPVELPAGDVLLRSSPLRRRRDGRNWPTAGIA